MSEMNEREQERREERRKRRIRNQIMAYMVVVVFVAALLTGGFFAGKYVVDKNRQKKQAELVDKIQEEIEVSENDIVLTEPETEPVEPQISYEEKADAVVDAAIEVMPLEDKVAGLFLVTPESITGVNTAIKAGDGTKSALEKYAVGGLVYSGKNIQSEEQFTEMLQNTVNWSKYPLFMAVQEEGGADSVVGKSAIQTEEVLSASEVAASGDTAQAYAAGTTVGGYLSRLGLNVDLAPVSDVAREDGRDFGSRIYGSDAATVAGYAVQMVNGLQDAGVSACMKHFPGLTSTTEDPAKEMAVTQKTADDFRANEFQVYQQGIAAGVDMIMVSQIAAPQITGDNTPCALSAAVVTDLLRKELQYDGIILSDAMDQAAITEYYSADEAAVMALRAGCDMIYMPENFEKAYQGVLDAVQNGTIAEERIDDALRRIYRVKLRDTIAQQLGE